MIEAERVGLLMWTVAAVAFGGVLCSGSFLWIMTRSFANVIGLA